MALTVNMINSVINAAGRVPTGVTITTVTQTGAGVTSRTPEQSFTVPTSTGRNANAVTGYNAYQVALDALIDTYLATFYDATESITFDAIITSVVVENTAATDFNTGTENYISTVTLTEKHA